MTTMCAYAAPHAGRRREGHFGAWRSVAALPAMIGSLLTLLVLFSWLGAWEGLVLLGWLASGAAVFTVPGERVAVRIGCGFRRPTAQQTAVLAPLWAQALAYAQLRPDQVDLYVQRSRDPNAYAAGGRSVAVTTGAVDEFQARRLGVAHMVSILTHELGHWAANSSRVGSVTAWLAAPWRFVSRLFFALGLVFAARQPRAVDDDAGQFLGFLDAAGHLVLLARRAGRARTLRGTALLTGLARVPGHAGAVQLAAEQFVTHGAVEPFSGSSSAAGRLWR